MREELRWVSAGTLWGQVSWGGAGWGGVGQVPDGREGLSPILRP